jgi:hypothetical protein
MGISSCANSEFCTVTTENRYGNSTGHQLNWLQGDVQELKQSGRNGS